MDPTDIEQAIREAYDDRRRGIPFWDYLDEDAKQLLQALAERGRASGRMPNTSAVKRILARQGQQIGETALRHWFQREIGA